MWHFEGGKFSAVSTPTVTLATAPDFRVMVLPRPERVSFVATGPMPTNRALALPNRVVGVPESVHRPVDAFVPFTWLVMRSVTYVVPAAALLRPTEGMSAVAPHGASVAAPDDANSSEALTGTASIVATIAPSRVLQSRITLANVLSARKLSCI
jgi:hypothetical protein